MVEKQSLSPDVIVQIELIKLRVFKYEEIVDMLLIVTKDSLSPHPKRVSHIKQIEVVHMLLPLRNFKSFGFFT